MIIIILNIGHITFILQPLVKHANCSWLRAVHLENGSTSLWTQRKTLHFHRFWWSKSTGYSSVFKICKQKMPFRANERIGLFVNVQAIFNCDGGALSSGSVRQRAKLKRISILRLHHVNWGSLKTICHENFIVFLLLLIWLSAPIGVKSILQKAKLKDSWIVCFKKSCKV